MLSVGAPVLNPDKPWLNDDQYGGMSEAGSAPQKPPKLPLVTPPNWRGTTVEPMRWLAANLIPTGDVTILSSDGGGGKTTIALQLAVAVAGGMQDWLGVVVDNGAVAREFPTEYAVSVLSGPLRGHLAAAGRAGGGEEPY
jgi:hypothetical protein